MNDVVQWLRLKNQEELISKFLYEALVVVEGRE
jgi:hypothetical protein